MLTKALPISFATDFKELKFNCPLVELGVPTHIIETIEFLTASLASFFYLIFCVEEIFEIRSKYKSDSAVSVSLARKNIDLYFTLDQGKRMMPYSDDLKLIKTVSSLIAKDESKEFDVN